MNTNIDTIDKEVEDSYNPLESFLSSMVYLQSQNSRKGRDGAPRHVVEASDLEPRTEDKEL